MTASAAERPSIALVAGDESDGLGADRPVELALFVQGMGATSSGGDGAQLRRHIHPGRWTGQGAGHRCCRADPDDGSLGPFGHTGL